jgi:hypothetical protein
MSRRCCIGPARQRQGSSPFAHKCFPSAKMLGQAKLAGVALAIGVVLFEVGSHSACVAQRCPILCGQRCGVSVSSCNQGCAKDEAVPFCWPAARWFLLVVIRNLPWRSAAAFLLGLPISKLHKRPASASPICAMCPQPQSEAQAPAVGPASRARALLARLNQRPAARSSRIQDSASCSPASLICHVHIGSNSHVTNIFAHGGCWRHSCQCRAAKTLAAYIRMTTQSQL